MAVIWCCRCI